MAPEPDEAKLWQDYRKTKAQKIRNQLIEMYAPLVKYIAGRLAISMPPNIEEDDLVGYGILGLIDAIDKFDPGREVKFRTYATVRIKGAILDELRAFDWIPRTVHQKSRQIELALLALENKLGHSPTDQEVADQLGIALDEYHNILREVSGITLLSVDNTFTTGSDDDEMTVLDALEGPPQENPETRLEFKDMKRVVAEGIRGLPEKEQQVIYLYYYEELTLKEIGKVLEVTESRISQLHTKAILRLKTILHKNMEIVTSTLNG